jgi:hypothetical protein
LVEPLSLSVNWTVRGAGTVPCVAAVVVVVPALVVAVVTGLAEVPVVDDEGPGTVVSMVDEVGDRWATVFFEEHPASAPRGSNKSSAPAVARLGTIRKRYQRVDRVAVVAKASPPSMPRSCGNQGVTYPAAGSVVVIGAGLHPT